jgi:hypothetical protein
MELDLDVAVDPAKPQKRGIKIYGSILYS